jgi:hypothetical protein
MEFFKNVPAGADDTSIEAFLIRSECHMIGKALLTESRQSEGRIRHRTAGNLFLQSESSLLPWIPALRSSIHARMTHSTQTHPFRNQEC